MSTPDRDAELAALHAQLDELRARLEESEETLHALRDGQVDAIVVGDDIYTLEGANAATNQLRSDALSQMQDGVVATDAAGRLIYLNSAAERLYGFAASEVLGLPTRALFEERWSSDADERAAARVGSGALPMRLQSVQRLRGADEIRVESTLSTLRDGDGQAVGTLRVLRDITQQARDVSMRLALVALSDHIRDIDDPAELVYAAARILGMELRISRAGFGMIDSVSETISIAKDWNDAGIRSLAGELHFRDYGSYIDDLVQGRTVIVADAFHDPRTEASAAALKAISAQAFINLPLTERGTTIGLLYLNHADAREWTPEELSFIRDVAERTRVAMARRDAQQQLQALARSLETQVTERTRERDRTWALSQDLLGVASHAGVFESVNPAWEAVLGWSSTELRRMSLRDLVHPEDLASTEAELQRLAEGQRTLRFENRYRHKDGSYRTLAWSAVPSDAKLYTVARDITDEKARALAFDEAQRQLRQSQKLQAVGQLTGGVAHDFNNLLQVISGNLQLIGKLMPESDRLKPRVEAAQAAVRRGAQLSKQLLAFSRQQPLEPRVINLGELMAGIEDMLRRSIGEGVEIVLSVEPGLWNSLVDPVQVESAVLNLAINARDAMQGRGRLLIEMSNAVLDAAQLSAEPDLEAGDYVLLAVTDDGSGMDAATVAQAFEPFFTTKPIGKGTGLGLSMVYGFVRQSNGHAKINSRPGVGTTVNLYLPRSLEGPTAAVPKTTSTTVEGGSEAVLVVEDDEAVLVTAVDLLRELGYRVCSAVNARDALTLIEAGERVDLLFTDVVMPGALTSPELAARARALLPRLAVLFTSGYPQDAIVHGGRLDAGVELLSKPYSRADLAAKVRLVLDRRPPESGVRPPASDGRRDSAGARR